MEPPEATKVEDAMELLKTIDALDEHEELTPLGKNSINIVIFFKCKCFKYQISIF